MGIVVRMLLLTTLLLASSTRALEDVEKGSCCESITLSSGGMGGFYQGERLGVFIRSGSSSSGRGIYTQSQGDNYLFFLSRDLGSLSDLGRLPLEEVYTHRARETTISSSCL